MTKYYLPNEKAFKKYEEVTDYNEFKAYINANWALSINGKFGGMDRIKNFELFRTKLIKKLCRRNKHQKPLGEREVIHISGQRIVIYMR